MVRFAVRGYIITISRLLSQNYAKVSVGAQSNDVCDCLLQFHRNRIVVGTYPPPLDVGADDRKFLRDENMIQLSAKNVRMPASKRILKAARGKTIFYFTPLAAPPKSVAHSPAEEPVERSNERGIKNIKVATDDGGQRGVYLPHSDVELLSARRGMRKYQVKAKYPNGIRISLYGNICKKTVPIFDARPVCAPHGANEQSCAQRHCERSERESAFGHYSVAAQDDEEVMLGPVGEESVDVGCGGNVYIKLCKPLEERFRHFLKTQHVEVEAFNKIERPIEIGVPKENVPGVDFHPVVEFRFKSFDFSCTYSRILALSILRP